MAKHTPSGLETDPVLSYQGWVMFAGRHPFGGDKSSLSKCSLSPGCIDLLLDVGVLCLWSKRVLVVGDLVAVAVGGDGACDVEPRRLLS